MRDGASALAFFGLLATQIVARSVISEDDLVHTSLGAIRGVKQVFNGTQLTAFLGIPYAKPPVGERRFGKPEKISAWNGELEAKKPSRTCFYTMDKTFPDFPGAEMWNPPPTVFSLSYHSITQSQLTEDCLALNIWVPPRHDGSVMVWIYGGGFFSGSPSLDLYDGSVLAAKYNKIVVNINYRWVNSHIGSFGGDPKRVTLFGESAGGASVTSHLLAPESMPLFNKIIVKSGTITNSWATRSKETLLETTLQLARLVNCSSTSGKDVSRTEVAKCLRAKPMAAIQEQADIINAEIGLPMTFAFSPVDDDVNYFKGSIWDRIRRRDFKKDVSVLIGSVADEGTYWLPYFLFDKKYGFAYNHTISAEDPQNKAWIDKSVSRLIGHEFHREQYKNSIDAFLPYFGNSPLVEHSLRNKYNELSQSNDDRERFRDGVARFLGDYFFTCGVLEFADLLADNVHGPLYMYYFTMRSSANPWPKWMGVMHGYEIEYVFGMPFRKPVLYNPQRIEVENINIRQYVYRSPGEFWPKYNRIQRKALVLGEELASGQHILTEDVHGSYCRLLAEAKTVIGQLPLNGAACRTARTGGSEAITSSSSSISAFIALPLYLVLSLTLI